MTSITRDIPYAPPPQPPQFYADTALEHLRHFERRDVRLLAYLLEPSNVLTLAGLRVFSPYNDALHPDLDESLFKKELVHRGLLWANENPAAAKPQLASFALINLDVADHLADTYPLDILRKIGPVFEHSEWAFQAWATGLDFAFARLMEAGTFPREWLKEWWNPHNIRFGMLLGYPGAAIASFVQAEAFEQDRSDMEEIVVSSELFNSTTVAFSVARAYRDHEDVVATVETWRATLSAVYAAYPPDKLLSNPEFAATVRAKR